MRKIIIIMLASFVFGLVAKNVSAQITVDNVLVSMATGDRPVHNVIVGNTSPNTAYVTVEVEKVTDPAQNPDKTEPSTDLLASPKAFSIEPNGQRTVRLLLKTPATDKELVFRVSFVPQDRGFGQEVTQSTGGRSTIIRVLTGMGILVFAEPPHAAAQLDYERVGDKISFSNTGNLQVYVGDGKSCTPAGACTTIMSKRIYAGEKFSLTTPAANTVTYLKREGANGDYQKLTIAPK